jgi:NAD(P)-dependent dehydrogenase (short-subunit alcohol dehydrogenase family)
MTARFNADSTTDDVLSGVNLKGKRALVTGVSAGLGVETARALGAHGAHVVGAARNLAKARSATEKILGDIEGGGGAFELVQLDLASLSSVRACADALNAAGKPFDLVIANAGVMDPGPIKRTSDGFEQQFGANHLGHFVLINRIAPLIKDGGRVVMLSSSAHHSADVDLNDPNFEHGRTDHLSGYGQSKTANILFAVEFDRRHRTRGVRAAAVHPGGIATELGRHSDTKMRVEHIKKMNEALAAKGLPPFKTKTVPQGAATSIWASVAPGEEVGGRYCEDCHVSAVVSDGNSLSPGVRDYAVDPARAAALWAKSEELVGERFS